MIQTFMADTLASVARGTDDGRMDQETMTALRIMMMPRDTNHAGTIFGGVILSHIDQAGYVEARKHGTTRWVTVALDRVEFLQPVMVGDIVAPEGCMRRIGKRGSMAISAMSGASRPGLVLSTS